jgi:RHS repeat-associated protein
VAAWNAASPGSSDILTDRLGNVVKHYEYTAFGKERFKDNTLAFSVSHRYTGQIFDDATGLYYYNARYYDPELGRFVQADSTIPSARDPQAFNRYSYVVNNPLKYVDPSGNLPFLAIVAIVAVAGAAIGAAVSAIQGRNVLQGALAGMFSGGLGAFLPDRYQQIVIAAGAAALFAIATTFAVGALWGAVSTTATVGQGLAWAASQAAVVGLSAAATTAVLNIPPVARALAKAGFWAEILASMALTFGFQLAFANLLYGPTNILNTDEYIQQQIAREGLTGDAAAQRAAQIRLELNQAAARLRVEGRGGTMFGSMPGDAAKIAGKDVGLVVGVEKVVVSRGQVVGYISEGMILGSPEHVGVAFVNVPSRIELRGWSGHLGGGYLLWGISHQTFSSTFLQAGYAGSVLTAGSGYSRYLSSFVYGPYGGGAFQALYNARGEL